MMEKRWRPEATGSPSLRAHPGQVMDRCCPDHRRTSGPLTHLYCRVTVLIWLPIRLEPYEAVCGEPTLRGYPRSGGETTMQAAVGDRLHVHGNTVGQADRTG